MYVYVYKEKLGKKGIRACDKEEKANYRLIHVV